MFLRVEQMKNKTEEVKPSPEYIIYLVGAVVLGLGYGVVKSVLGGGWLFLLCVVAYLLALRLIGAFVRRREQAKAPRSDA